MDNKKIKLFLAAGAGLVAVSAVFLGLNKVNFNKPAGNGTGDIIQTGSKNTTADEKIKIEETKLLEQQEFDLKFDTFPRRSSYILTLADGSELKGTSPFSQKVKGGNAKITLELLGYNILKKDILLDKNTDTNFYLDKTGQLVHHLSNIDPLPSPKGIAFTPDGSEIWAALLLNKTRGLSVFDPQTGKNIADIDLEGGGGVEVIFSKDGSKAYVSQMETAKVYEIDAKTKKILRSFDTKSTWTKVIELSADGTKLFASNWSGNDISEFNLSDGKLIRRIPTVKTPRGLYATQDGKTLYAAGFDKGDIEKIDLETGKGKIIYSSGGAMRHIVADEDKGILYISDMANRQILTVDLKNDSVKKFVDTDINPNTIDLSPDKKVLYVSCRGQNATADNYYIPGPEWGSVLLFDTATGKMLDAIVGGNQPTALDVSQDGKLLVFSDFLDMRLEVFEVPSYETLENGNGGRSAVYRNELKK